MQGFGIRVQGLGFRAYRALGLGLGVRVLGFRASDFRVRGQNLRFRFSTSHPEIRTHPD